MKHNQTGVELATTLLIEGLCQEGHDIVCFHIKNKKFPPLENVTHYFFRKPSPILFSHSFFSLFHYKCFHKVDILHCTSPKIAYFKKSKVPIVLTVHDIGPYLYPEFNSKRSHFLFKYILPKYFKEADALITPSEIVKRDLIENYNVELIIRIVI